MYLNEKNVKEMDFSFLEGRVIDLDSNFKRDKGVIVGCDYYIGLSIMSPDKQIYIFCLRGPSTWRKFEIKETDEKYMKDFTCIVNGIISHNILDIEHMINDCEVSRLESDGCSFV